MLISFEGLPGAGKSTQARRLATRLTQDGRTVAYLPDLATLTVDPIADALVALFASSGDPFRRHGDVVTDTLLAAAIRAHIVGAALTPALATHDIVIEDRGVHTMYAFSLATAARDHPGLDTYAVDQWLSALGALAGTQADIVVWLQVPVSTAIRRATGRDRGTYTGEQTSYLAHVDDAYRRLSTGDARLATIAVGEHTAGAVHELIYAEITRRMS